MTVTPRVVGTWAAADDNPVAHAEVIGSGPSDAEVPDGVVTVSWTDRLGRPREVQVVRWWRLDRDDLEVGTQVQVDVVARQRRHMSCPPHHISAVLRVTGFPEDKAQVMVGDPDRAGSWSYGVAFSGATLTATTVLFD